MRHTLIRSNDDIGRVYHTPDGDFYSVTTMLSCTKDMSGLDAWRKRIGDEEAKRITERAANIGTYFHLYCEERLTGKTINELKNAPAISKMLFQHVVLYIDKYLNETLHSEIALYNKQIKLAGTTDGIVIWDNVLSILDFKTCGWLPKSARDPYILDYWIQSEIYRYMASEMLGLKIKNSVLLFAGKKIPKGMAFTLPEDMKKDVAEQTFKRINMFKKMLDK